MLVYKDNKFYEIVIGGDNIEIVPNVGDFVDIYSSDVGMEHALLQLQLHLKGNRIEQIIQVTPPIRKQERYLRKNKSK